MSIEYIKSKKSFDDMEPRFIVEKEGKYYLITSGGRHKSISHFRVDKIDNIRILGQPISEDFRYQEAYEYALKRVYMFSGEPVLVKLRCTKHIPNIYDKMIDAFGENAVFEDVDDNYFDILTRGTPTGIMFLAQKYIDAVQIIFPNDLKNKMLFQVYNAYKRYSV